MQVEVAWSCFWEEVEGMMMKVEVEEGEGGRKEGREKESNGDSKFLEPQRLFKR